MPFVTVVPIDAIRRAQEAQNARFEKALDECGITTEMENAILPAQEQMSGLFTGLNALNAHKEILCRAIDESRKSGQKMTLERLQQIAADYRHERSWRGRLASAFGR